MKWFKKCNSPSLVSFPILLHDAVLIILDTAGQVGPSSAVDDHVRPYCDFGMWLSTVSSNSGWIGYFRHENNCVNYDLPQKRMTWPLEVVGGLELSLVWIKYQGGSSPLARWISDNDVDLLNKSTATQQQHESSGRKQQNSANRRW